jgi:hypothetical protein
LPNVGGEAKATEHTRKEAPLFAGQSKLHGILRSHLQPTSTALNDGFKKEEEAKNHIYNFSNFFPLTFVTAA